VIGQRYSEDKPAEKFSIKSDASVVSAVKDGLESGFKKANLTKKPGRAEMKVALTYFNIDEKMFRRSEYVGRVVLEVSLVQPNSTKACWSATFQGDGNNYGYAGSPENYHETVGRALDKAVDNLVKDPGFNQAICGTCGGATSSAR
jgi:hypothetical protein